MRATQTNIIPLPARKAPKPSVWERTKHTNLVRHKGSGVYYVRAKVRGRSIRKSLKTQSVEIALAKLAETLGQSRQRRAERMGKLTLAALARYYRMKIKHDPDLRASSKKYRLETLQAIERTWHGQHEAQRFTPAALEVWAAALRKQYGATRYNAILETMRAMLKPAVDRGVLHINPVDEAISTERVKRATVVVKDRDIPSEETLKKLFAALKPNKGKLFRQGARTSNTYYLCRFLRHFSLRVGTARKLTTPMVKRDKGEFHIPSEIVKWGGNGKIYRVPIFPAMVEVLDELDEVFGKDRKMVIPFNVSPYSLRSASVAVGIQPPLTWHSWRHIFSSYALMATKDPVIVAAWRGDKDKGATLLKTYAHILDDYSREMAAKVK